MTKSTRDCRNFVCYKLTVQQLHFQCQRIDREHIGVFSFVSTYAISESFGSIYCMRYWYEWNTCCLCINWKFGRKTTCQLLLYIDDWEKKRPSSHLKRTRTFNGLLIFWHQVHQVNNNTSWSRCPSETTKNGMLSSYSPRRTVFARGWIFAELISRRKTHQTGSPASLQCCTPS